MLGGLFPVGLRHVVLDHLAPFGHAAEAQSRRMSCFASNGSEGFSDVLQLRCSVLCETTLFVISAVAVEVHRFYADLLIAVVVSCRLHPCC